MLINVKEFKELENGSADLVVELDEPTKRYLINFAFVEILRRELDEVEQLWEECKND